MALYECFIHELGIITSINQVIVKIKPINTLAFPVWSSVVSRRHFVEFCVLCAVLLPFLMSKQLYNWDIDTLHALELQCRAVGWTTFYNPRVFVIHYNWFEKLLYNKTDKYIANNITSFITFSTTLNVWVCCLCYGN